MTVHSKMWLLCNDIIETEAQDERKIWQCTVRCGY